MPSMLILGNLQASLANVFRFWIRSRRYLGKNACWCSPQTLFWLEMARRGRSLDPGSNNKFRPPSVDILMGGASCEPHNLISVSRTADDKDRGNTLKMWKRFELNRSVFLFPHGAWRSISKNQKNHGTYQDGCLLTCHNLSLACRLHPGKNDSMHSSQRAWYHGLLNHQPPTLEMAQWDCF